MCKEHDFIFDYTKAYIDQFLAFFEKTRQHPLSDHGAPDAFGVYALYDVATSKTNPIYVGKADRTQLRRRLTEHAKKIKSRPKLHLDKILCRYVVVPERELVAAVAAESILIRTYKPLWNGSGFGGHVPGAGRPGIRIGKWDQWYPK